jgi:cytochrome c peroxidase
MPLLISPFSRSVTGGLAVLLAVALAGCQRPAPPAAAAAPATAPVPAYVGATYAPVPGRPQPGAAQLSALGRRIFFDASLSASGAQSCASCHDPRHAYGPPNALSVQLGGADGRTPGPRASPSLR